MLCKYKGWRRQLLAFQHPVYSSSSSWWSHSLGNDWLGESLLLCLSVSPKTSVTIWREYPTSGCGPRIVEERAEKEKEAGAAVKTIPMASGAWVAQSVEVWLQLRSRSRGREFEPRVGLWADGSEPGACFLFCVSLSLCPSPVHALPVSVSKINKR